MFFDTLTIDERREMISSSSFLVTMVMTDGVSMNVALGQRFRGIRSPVP